MSYNHYPGYNTSNNYSPYYQQNIEQDGHGQYQDQPRSSGSYQGNPYQPLNAYQSNQQAQAPAPQSANISAYATQEFRSARPEDTRGSFPNSGRPVDISALGSLAYASSLGRDQSALQSPTGYKPTPSTAGYSNSNAHMVSAGSATYGTGRAEDNGSNAIPRVAPTARPQRTTSTLPYGYNANGGYAGQQREQPDPGATEPGNSHQATSNTPRATTQSQYNSLTVPPTGGQAVQDTRSRMGTQSSSSPITRTNQANSVITGRNSGDVHETDQTRVSSPAQRVNSIPGAATESRAGSSLGKVQDQQVAPGAIGANRGQPVAQASPKTTSFSQSGPANNARQPPAENRQVQGNVSPVSKPVGDQHLATVDPSQVFNHSEYMRRKAAAAAGAEAANKKATEAMQPTVQAKDINPSNARLGVDQAIPAQQRNGTPSSHVPRSSDSEATTAKEAQMELEMKQMIEKMREYKSKDPALFSQIWEQVKKAQPAPRAPSQPAPQASSASPVVVNGRLASPNTSQSQLPPESELPPAQITAELDRGRYPAQRRRRGSKDYTPPRKAPAPQSGSGPSTVERTSSPGQAPGTKPMKKATKESHTKADPLSQKPSTGLASPASDGIQSLPQQKSSSNPLLASDVGRQQPQPSERGETIWPEHKKQALAEAGSNALNTDPRNKGRQITAAEIHKILDQNPSYTVLCEILEWRGFVIDRGQFARLLLAAVPDLAPATAPKRPSESSASKPPTTGPPTPSTRPPAGSPTVLLTTGPPPTSVPPSSAQRKLPHFQPYPIPRIPNIHSEHLPPQNAALPPGARDYRMAHPYLWTPNEQRQYYPSPYGTVAAGNSPIYGYKPTGAGPIYEPTGARMDLNRRSYINANSAHSMPPNDNAASQQGKTSQAKDGQFSMSTLKERDGADSAMSTDGIEKGEKRILTYDRFGQVIDITEKLQRVTYSNGIERTEQRSLTYDGRERIEGVTYSKGISNLPINSLQVPTKQDLARKRTFGEIVDLTQMADEEPPPQRPCLNNDRLFPLTSRNGDGLIQDASAITIPSSTGTIAREQLASDKFTSTPMSAQSSMKRVKSKPSGREYLWFQADIVRPMNKRQDALRRSRYDPKTIARDILIAVGKHPTMTPLNSHLDILREKFKAVNNESDLSTFRWDLVDPGDPPVRFAPMLEKGDANDADDEEPLTPSRRTLATRRDPRISVVVGVGVDEGGGVNAEANSVPKTFKNSVPRRHEGRPSRGGYASSSMQSRADGSGASVQSQGASGQQSTPIRQHERPNQQPTTHPHHLDAQISDNNQDLSRFMYAAPTSIRTATTMNGVQTPSYDGSMDRTPAGLAPPSKPPLSTPEPDTVTKRKGRPPGAKNKRSRPDKGSHTIKAEEPSPGNSDLSTPPRFRPATNMTTPVRPSGLRNAMTPTDGIAVIIPSRSPSIVNTPQTESAKRGRPKKTPVPIRRHPPPPSYKIYRCLWEDCPAELHNLETLKKHVRKHCDRSEAGPFPCLWANCYSSNSSVNNRQPDGDERERLKFESDTAWEKHMEGKHVNAIAWELGDGPVTHSSDYDSSDHMSDSRRSQPTPKGRPSSQPNFVPMSSPPNSVQGAQKANGDSAELIKNEGRIEPRG